MPAHGHISDFGRRLGVWFESTKHRIADINWPAHEARIIIARLGATTKSELRSGSRESQRLRLQQRTLMVRRRRSHAVQTAGHNSILRDARKNALLMMTVPELQIHHHVVALDRHRERLGDIGPLHHAGAGLDMRGIGFDAKAFGVAIGLAGADVELPAVPGAAQDLAQSGIDHSGLGGLRKPDQWSFAQGGALVRAAVHQAEEFALDVEDRDRPLIDGEEFTRARRQFATGAMTWRAMLLYVIPYSFLALPR